MLDTALAETPAKEKTYLYLVSYVERGEGDRPVLIRPDEKFTVIARQILPLPMKIDTKDKLEGLEEALTESTGTRKMIVAISPLF